MTKTSGNFFSTLRDIVSSYLQRVSNIATLAKLETKLAIQSALKITITIYLLGFFLASTWLSLLVMLFLYFVSLHFSLLFSAAITLIPNLAVVAGLLIYILKLKHHLSFPATRKQLRHKNELQERNV